MSAAHGGGDRGHRSVSVLIVNYRSTPMLLDCLASIEGQTAFARTETIVVDNGSPDFEPDQLTARFPWVHVIASPVNLTYTGGNNLAFERARGDCVLLLNPDTVLEPRAIENALRHFASGPPMSAQGATLLNADGSLQRYYRRLPTWRDVPYVLLGRLLARTPGGRRYFMLDDEFGPVTAVDQPPGAFLLLRRADVGDRLLDPGYYNYMSDVELCARLRATGPIYVFDDVRCWHRKGAAGVATGDTADQLRLRHDLTWGVRRYYRNARLPIRSYVEAWLYVFWCLRLGQLAIRRPSALGRAVRLAARALRGDPPRYEPGSS